MRGGCDAILILPPDNIILPNPDKPEPNQAVMASSFSPHLTSPSRRVSKKAGI